MAAPINPIVAALLANLSAAGLAKIARVMLKNPPGAQQRREPEEVMDLIHELTTLEHAEGRLSAAVREVAACEAGLRRAREAVIAQVFQQVASPELLVRLYQVAEDTAAAVREEEQRRQEQVERKAVRRKKKSLIEKE